MKEPKAGKSLGVLFSIEESTDLMLNFIGSEQYSRILDSITDTKQSGFMTGMSVMLSLISIHCTKYSIYEPRNREELDKQNENSSDE